MEDNVQGPDEQLDINVFEAADFDAYLPNKWNSNMYTLERRRVKTKLEALGNQLVEELENAGLSLIMHSSDEFPSFWNKKRVDSQWLFFSRGEAAREELSALIDKERTLKDTLEDPTPLYRHLFLGVSVNETHLEIGLRLHHDAWVDRRNFLGLFAGEEPRGKLAGTIAELPEHYQLSTNDENLQSLEGFDMARLEALVNAFDTEKAWLFIGARLPRDQVLVLGGDISDTAREVFQCLIPVYRFIAWSPSNDAIAMDEVLRERNEALRQTREVLDRERAEREARLREQEAVGAAMKQEIADKIHETEVWRSREVAARRAAAARAASAARDDDARAKAEAMAAQLFGPKTEKPDAEANPRTEAKPRTEDKARGKPRPRPRWEDRKPERTPKPVAPFKAEPPKTVGDVSVGAFIEVTKGFLKGRWGKVQEIDEKGGLKVGFGVLSSRLELDEVMVIDPEKRKEEQAHRGRGSKRRQQKGSGGRFRDTLSKE